MPEGPRALGRTRRLRRDRWIGGSAECLAPLSRLHPGDEDSLPTRPYGRHAPPHPHIPYRSFPLIPRHPSSWRVSSFRRRRTADAVRCALELLRPSEFDRRAERTSGCQVALPTSGRPVETEFATGSSHILSKNGHTG